MRANTAANVLVACAVTLAGCQGAGNPLSPSGPSQAGPISGSSEVGGATLQPTGNPNKPHKPGQGSDATFEMTITFGHLVRSGERADNLDGSQLVIGMGGSGQGFPVSTVAGVDTSACFPEGSEGRGPNVVAQGTADALEVAARFTAPDSMGKDARYDVRLTGDPAGDWFPQVVGVPTILAGTDWDIKKVQGKGSSEPCASSADPGQSPVAWELRVTRTS